MDTKIYKIEYHNSNKQTLAVNIITENLFACVDKKGHRYLLLDEILDVRTTKETIEKKNIFVILINRNRKKETTKGWEMLVQ